MQATHGTERSPYSITHDGIVVNVFCRADGLWYVAAAGLERSYTKLNRAIIYGKKLASKIAAAQ